NNEKEWIQHNLVRLNQISSKHHSFGLLQGYCKKIFENDPISFLKSQDISFLEKSTLISILSYDDLKVDEIDEWDYAIRWGIGQFENLEGKNISEWNNNDIVAVKNVFNDIVPIIRLYGIS